MTQKQKSLFSPSRIIFFVVSLLVFYFGIHYFGKIKDIEALLLQMSPAWLFMTVGAQLFTYIFNAAILKTLLKKEAKVTNFLTLFKTSIVIMFVNQALPTGGISGNGYIFNQLVKRGVPGGRAFSTLVIESISYYIAFVLLLAVFYGWYMHDHTVIPYAIRYGALTGFVFYIALGIVVLIASNQRTVDFILDKLKRFGRIQRYIKKVSLLSPQKETETDSNLFAGKQKETLISILLQIGIIMADVITAYALLKGFHINISFHLITFGLLLSLVVGALPISPGSLIVYESAMTYFFTTLGVPVQAALTVTLLYRFFTFWLPIPIGLILYKNLQRD